MAYKSFKPYTPGRRQMTVSAFDEITTDTPEKSLLAPIHNHGGRNGSGKMTVRHQGGGHKRQYRIIDFKRVISQESEQVLKKEFCLRAELRSRHFRM